MPANEVKIDVTAIIPTYQVEFIGHGCTPTGIAESYTANQNVSFKVTPDAKYELPQAIDSPKILVEGIDKSKITYNPSIDNTFAFKMPSNKVTINVTALAIFTVSMESDNLDITIKSVTEGKNLNTTIFVKEEFKDDYRIPGFLEYVNVNDQPLFKGDYKYNPETGELYIDAKKVVGKIDIKANARSIYRYVSILNKKTIFDIDDLQYELQIESKNAGTLIYESSDETVATVDEKGISFTNKQGSATVTVKSREHPNVYDSFTFITTKKIVTGTLTDSDTGNPLDSVLVSACGESTTFRNGNYKLALPEESAVAYFEKEGYITEARFIDSTFNETQLNISMKYITSSKRVTIEGTVIDFKTNEPLSNISVSTKTDSIHTAISDENGHYCFKDIWAGEHVVLDAFYHSYSTISQEVEIGTQKTINQNLVMKNHQYPMRFYVSDPSLTTTEVVNIIYGNVYHTTKNNLQGLSFVLKSNFSKAFADNIPLKIFLDLGPKSNHERDVAEHKDGRDVDVKFDNTGTILDYNSHGGSQGTGSLVVETDKDRNLAVFIPNTLTKIPDDSKETIGFAFGYNGDEMTDEDAEDLHCWPFGAPVRQRNKHSFARLEYDDTTVSASDNKSDSIFNGIDYFDVDNNDEFYSSGVLGSIGFPHSGGFDVKIAKNKNNPTGIYVLTNSTYPNGYTEFYMRDLYARYICIDTNAGSYHGHSYKDSDVYHFENNGNSWIKENNPNSKKYDGLYEYNVRYYSRGTILFLYVPYDYLGVNSKNNLGFAFKIDQNGDRSWGEIGWKFPKKNPTGYSSLPDWDSTETYIHLDERLSIIPYK